MPFWIFLITLCCPHFRCDDREGQPTMDYYDDWEDSQQDEYYKVNNMYHAVVVIFGVVLLFT